MPAKETSSAGLAIGRFFTTGIISPTRRSPPETGMSLPSFLVTKEWLSVATISLPDRVRSLIRGLGYRWRLTDRRGFHCILPLSVRDGTSTLTPDGRSHHSDSDSRSTGYFFISSSTKGPIFTVRTELSDFTITDSSAAKLI